MNRFQTGFTLVELVTVMVLLGILSAAGLARMSNRQTFDAVGFADEVRQTMQYGRRLAVAQRRTVCINFSSTSLSLTQAGTAGSGVACSLAVIDPMTGSAVSLDVPGGMALSGTSFRFDAQGRQTTGSSILVSVVGDGLTRSVTVENETGYVH